MLINSQLFALQLHEEGDIKEYVRLAMEYRKKLIMLGEPLLKTMSVNLLFNGLSRNYNMMIQLINNLTPLPSFNKCVTRIP